MGKMGIKFEKESRSFILLLHIGKKWVKINDSRFWDWMTGWIMVFWVVKGNSRWEAGF